MNVNSITSDLYSAYIKNAAASSKSVSENTGTTQTAPSGDIVTLGSDGDTVYATYTSSGVCTDSTSSDTPVSGSGDTESAKLTGDEKWDSITSKYRSGILKLDDYMQMLSDLQDAGLITADEKATAASHATSVIEAKRNEYDMRDGKLNNEPIPDSLNIIYFDELTSDLSNESSTSGLDADKSEFLKNFYSKAKDAEMTEDEKWQMTVSKYAGKPLTFDNYIHMICDFGKAGVMSDDEVSAATAHAMAVVGDKTVVYDMRDGILGNDEIPTSLYLVDLGELFSDLSNENRVYEGFTESNDPRPFLNTFYQKLSDYLGQETVTSDE